MTQQATRSRVSLSPTQILAGSLAAVTSAVAASKLGVGGTLAGAAVGSIVATVGQAYYEHYLDRTRHRLRSAVVRRANPDSDPTQGPTQEEPVLSVPASGRIPPASTGQTRARRLPERLPAGARRVALALSAVAAFAVALTAVTLYETATGGPISASGSNGGGTSIGRVLSGDASNASQPGDGTVGSTPEPTSSPTTSPEPTPTDTPSPGATQSPQPTVQPATPQAPAPGATPGSAGGGGGGGGGGSGATPATPGP